VHCLASSPQRLAAPFPKMMLEQPPGQVALHCSEKLMCCHKARKACAATDHVIQLLMLLNFRHSRHPGSWTAAVYGRMFDSVNPLPDQHTLSISVVAPVLSSVKSWSIWNLSSSSRSSTVGGSRMQSLSDMCDMC